MLQLVSIAEQQYFRSFLQHRRVNYCISLLKASTAQNRCVLYNVERTRFLNSGFSLLSCLRRERVRETERKPGTVRDGRSIIGEYRVSERRREVHNIDAASLSYCFFSLAPIRIRFRCRKIGANREWWGKCSVHRV